MNRNFILAVSALAVALPAVARRDAHNRAHVGAGKTPISLPRGPGCLTLRYLARLRKQTRVRLPRRAVDVPVFG